MIHPIEFDKQPMRRIAFVRITSTFLMDFLKTSDFRCLKCQGVPADAKPYRIAYEPRDGYVMCFYEHESFDPVYEGNICPEIKIVVTERHGDPHENH